MALAMCTPLPEDDDNELQPGYLDTAEVPIFDPYNEAMHKDDVLEEIARGVNPERFDIHTIKSDDFKLKLIVRIGWDIEAIYKLFRSMAIYQLNEPLENTTTCTLYFKVNAKVLYRHYDKWATQLRKYAEGQLEMHPEYYHEYFYFMTIEEWPTHQFHPPALQDEMYSSIQHMFITFQYHVNQLPYQVP